MVITPFLEKSNDHGDRTQAEAGEDPGPDDVIDETGDHDKTDEEERGGELIEHGCHHLTRSGECAAGEPREVRPW